MGELPGSPENLGLRIEFSRHLDTWVDATQHLSGRHLEHPSAEAVLQYGPQAIPWLTQYLKDCRDNERNFVEGKNPWPAFAAIARLTPRENLPEIPQEASGRIHLLLDIFKDWGIEKGYLDTTIP